MSRRAGAAGVVRAYAALLAGLGLLGGGAVAALALSVSTDVLLRNLGVGNFPWLLDLSEYVIYASTFLAAPWVLHQNAHVRVDLLVNALPRRGARALEVFADGLGLAISATLGYYGLAVARDSFALGGVVVKELVVPEWWLLAVIPCACALLTCEFCLRLTRALRGQVRPSGRI